MEGKAENREEWTVLSGRPRLYKLKGLYRQKKTVTNNSHLT